MIISSAIVATTHKLIDPVAFITLFIYVTLGVVDCTIERFCCKDLLGWLALRDSRAKK